ncbi:hypothetical protein BCU33_013110 [Vibrio lentus]|uniref:hypothetical protein n=1 Tax=Vibrio lentus TaxID=136468 RepID=UPI000C8212F9|nr:hypothetical protein [Vibrio lentus]MCC4784511.1 hypothetical protein [Vibrio lentus]PMI92262.1 hypothetical protein BCU33_09695 [Vibrio lentus]PMJ06106.1 hypothetical protein BCU31_03335 [Vibrio lentus]TKG19614.1 hypothetical protein FCW05_09010 [Vibrio lentus]
MKFKLNLFTTFAIFSVLTSTFASAFNVDKMIIVADKKGNGVVTLINDESHPIFVDGKVEEIQVVDGDEIVRHRYKRDNLDDWKISLTHPRLVLRPGEEKDVGIRSLCHNTSCDNSKDLMFMLPFTPSRYKKEGEKLNGVEINYGFSPMYIVPTIKPNFNYKLYNRGEKLRIDNDSNTLIDVYVNSCSKYNSTQCKQKFTVVSGRDKTFSLAKNTQSEQLNVTVTSYNKKYSNELELTILQ